MIVILKAFRVAIYLVMPGINWEKKQKSISEERLLFTICKLI